MECVPTTEDPLGMDAYPEIRHAAYHQNYEPICDLCLRGVNSKGYCDYCDHFIPDPVCPDCGVARHHRAKR